MFTSIVATLVNVGQGKMKRRIKKLRTAVVAASFAVCVASGADASLILNGGFETGDFTGWSTIGVTSIETAGFGTAPAEGTFQALMTTNDSFAVSDATIEDFLGLTAGSLDTLVGADATDGSAIKQTVSGTVGDVINF